MNPSRNLRRAVEISRAFVGSVEFEHRCRHFSFLFDGSKLVSMGVNSLKTHPSNLKYRYLNRSMNKIGFAVGTHSEMKAFLKMGDSDCRGLVLVNTRIDRNGNLGYCFPCTGCRDVIDSKGVKEVFYVGRGGFFERMELGSSALI